MPNFEKLRITEGNSFTIDKWGELIDELEDLSLTIPTNTNGEVLNSVTVGTKPGDGSVMNYPWEYESIGVAKTNHNLRLQSPGSVYVHTNIGGDLEKNRTRIPLTIHKNDSVGIGLNYPEEPQAKLQIINANQDANGDTLVLGKINEKTSNLRLGYHQDYSWIQSHGSKPLSINSKGNNVGIGIEKPEKLLHIHSKSKDNGLKITSEGIKPAIYLHLANNDWGEYGYFHLGGYTKLRGNGKVSTFEGSLGVGLKGNPKSALHVSGQMTIQNSASQRGFIVMHGSANTEKAKSILNGLNKHQLVIGGAWNEHIYFYWKDSSGRKRMARIKGGVL